ncbi:FAD-dependent monooxygenase [Legionella taurinensis]|uniref:FAD-dependent monooxygenase n=1 Tax=Legionella taurinensis TaxID=70611 RepID=A0A3A5LEG5_9GAMM|nr:NAD(P)/FAD-dependent oxidoreductase [Legionella taurinensis]MDX1836741.1 NAD(P)/FAD-dependent oxidoreductase [Legionella taurinensis]PUT41483.1 FAD-dependent monooxygenase [Legionella taurinensis]PUT42807.1 FAD-dependent monooxygenase [Legionella taurinensis]PUT45362.1 FAD-dependent monooxygenase [Legionella taurinensis]PUT49129.1 FAD-dependent monooxygenase [Legionella taurinensis]
MRNLTIIGSGLAGTLLALYMARRGYKVDIYESRPDLRLKTQDRGRSINLALSCRGLTGLAGVGLSDKAKAILVPMRARAIHEEEGSIKYQAFGRHPDEYINAVQRSDLNALLLDTADSLPTITIYFDMKLLNVDVRQKVLHFEDKAGQRSTIAYERLIGADGAGSQVRESLMREGLVTSSRNYLPHGYKELSISSGHPEQLVREHLHLWPRDSFLLLGNPNTDHSITGSLFMPHQGVNSFAELDNEVKITRFFKQAFPDAVGAMPDLVGEFLHNPTGHMSTIKTSPWYYRDECLLIGDAAHGIVPFFGQGMNSAFEDCRILNELLDQYDDDWQTVMPAFYKSRKVNTEAVARMSMDNYHEIQIDIRDARFNLKKQLEQELMHRYPNRYVSKHVLVMFTNTPYSEAMALGDIQGELLNVICDEARCVEEINWKQVDLLMDEYDKKLANLAPQ